MTHKIPRRAALAGLAALGTGACSQVSDSATFSALAQASQDAHRRAHRALARKQALAPEYSRADLSPSFRGNGSVSIPDRFYRDELERGFARWRLEVRGLVETPLSLSMAAIRALPQRTQITRHDCVEGWSAIGEWTGVPLSHLLESAQVKREARFILFHCADILYGTRYYESIDMVDAYHPQTIVAHALNGAPLEEKNGAPLRMRVERQLGYKHPKYLTAIEAVTSFDQIEGGQGGFWEDRGYQWYAGI